MQDTLEHLVPSMYAPTYVYGSYSGWRRVADFFRVPRRYLGARPKLGNWFYRIEVGGKVDLICSFETYAQVKKNIEHPVLKESLERVINEERLPDECEIW